MLYCSLVRNANKRRPFPDANKVQIFCVSFEDQRLEQTDFAVVHDSPSIGAGPSIALYLKTRFLYSLSVCVVQWS